MPRSFSSRPILMPSVCALALLAAGCAHVPPAPVVARCSGWSQPTDPPRDQFPSPSYIVGVGAVSDVLDNADAKNAAESDATGQIAKQLAVEVQAKTSVQQSAGSAGSNVSIKDFATEKTSTLSIPGSQVVATCYEPGTTTYYALEVVERRALLRAFIAQAESGLAQAKATRAQAAASEGANRLLDALKVMREAVQELDKDAREMAIVRGLGGQASEEPRRAADEARRELSRLRARLGVQVSVPGDPIVAQALRQVVPAAGLTLRNPGETKDVVLSIVGDAQPPEFSRVPLVPNAVVAHRRVVVNIVRTDTGEAVQTLSLERQESSVASAQRAVELADAALARALKPEVEKVLESVVDAK